MTETQSLTDCTLLDTVTWFQKARPNPSEQDFSTQLGVHFEEVREMVLALKANHPEAQALIDTVESSLHSLGNLLKANPGIVTVADPLEMLDGLCDQVVTGTGVAHTLGYDILGAMDEVNRSNFSKFVDGEPLYNENKKVTKGPNYFKPDLTPYLHLPV